MSGILALDLGTRTGWAYNPAPGAIVSGMWDFRPASQEVEGERYDKFRTALDKFAELHYLTQLEVVYEDVKAHKGTRACHVYGGLLATLKVWCLSRGIKCTGVGVGQIKKFWTGKGNAKKDAMIAEAHARGFEPADDNEADALALLHHRLIGGPIAPKPKTPRRRTGSSQPGKSLARRAAGGLREGDGRLPQGRRQRRAPDQEPIPQGAGGDGGGGDGLLDKAG